MLYAIDPALLTFARGVIRVNEQFCSRPRCDQYTALGYDQCFWHAEAAPRDGDEPLLPWPHAYVLADTRAEAA